MYSKIAFKNVKKSFKDYTIYFLTLTLAVCIFYSFNSLESQTAFMNMEASTSANVDMLANLISYLSIFVSVILGSLILYANNFLIKKRKKELGIYTILGMSKQHVSKILVLETLLVGALSLVSGLALGLIASQGLSIFTAKLFEVTMSEFHFIVSSAAIGKTILYFGMMFLLVILFNTVVISRYNVIDLLNANKKIERIKFNHPVIYVVSFLGSVVSLFFAYQIILANGLLLNEYFIISCALGILGTFLFFFSLANICLIMLQGNKGAYYKGLNIFITKQMSSKVHTNYMSISVICLMLFLTLGILSTGISFKSAFESGLASTTPFSASAYIFPDEMGPHNIEWSLEQAGYTIKEDTKIAKFTEYDSDVLIGEFLYDKVSASSQAQLDRQSMGTIKLISESDYNDVNELANRPIVTLADNEVLVLSSIPKMVSIVNDFLALNDEITFNGKPYTLKNKTAIEETLYSGSYSSTVLTFIVPDEVVTSYDPYTMYLNFNFASPSDEVELSEAFYKFFNSEVDLSKTDFVIGYTRTEIYDSTKGMTTTVLFVGIYLGIVFLISSMAVLALQQLSEASDSLERYQSLKKIGATDKMINKTIFIQTILYFTLPIMLALVHSVIGIKVVNEFIITLSQPDIGSSALITALIFLTVYLGYFYATYTGYKNIVKQS